MGSQWYGLEDTYCITVSAERFLCAEASGQECFADMTISHVSLQLVEKTPKGSTR